jgi:hypothetical protein
MCKLLLAAGTALVLQASAASAGLHPVTATLDLTLGILPTATLTGSAAAAASAGAGGAATLPAGSLTGLFSATLAPPFLTLLDGIGLAAPGIVGAFAGAAPASSYALSFDGAVGTMPLHASAYLLMAGNVGFEIPLAVVGVGGTYMDPNPLVPGTVYGSPYQLGVLTLMGVFNGVPHTLMATGFDGRTAGGEGTLVLVSPNVVHLGVVGSMATIATLTLGIGPAIPEPGTLLLLGAGLAALGAGRRGMPRATGR